jgi:hypothetical protein
MHKYGQFCTNWPVVPDGFDSLHPLQPRPFSFSIRKSLEGTGLTGAFQIGVTSGFCKQNPSYDSFSTVRKTGPLAISNLQRCEPVLPTHFPGPLYTAFYPSRIVAGTATPLA